MSKPFQGLNLRRAFGAIVTVALLLHALTPLVQAQSNSSFVTGVNYPWVAYGHDFGKNSWGHDGISSSGWTYQTYAGSNGFNSTRLSSEQKHGGSKSLRVGVDLNPAAGRGTGEVYLDLNNHPPQDVPIPLNADNKTGRFWIYLPTGISGSASAPNYIQPFLKSQGFASWYGAAQNISVAQEGKWIEIVFNTAATPAFADPNFDMSKIVAVGLKIGIGGNSSATFKGTIYVDDFSLNTAPALAFDYETSEVERDFINLRQSIGNCTTPVARVFVFSDGRAAPEFNSNGEVTGFDDQFYSDFDELVAIAKRQSIKLMPVLLDFLWFDTARTEAGVQIGGRSSVISNATKRQTFINNALIPLINRYKNESQIYSWDIINEPEWAMSDVPKDAVVGAPIIGGQVTTAQMRDFIKASADVINARTAQKVTVGGARRTWLGLWKNLNLDLYQFHWYDKFAAASPPDSFAWLPASQLNLDKPVLVGEVATKNTNYSAENYLNAASAGGYQGVLFWSYRAKDDFSNFAAAKPAVQSWCR